MTNAWAIPKVAGQGGATLRKLLAVDARFIGNLRCRAVCFRIGRFPRSFCVAATRKGARLWRISQAPVWSPQSDFGRGGKPPAVRPFGTL